MYHVVLRFVQSFEPVTRSVCALAHDWPTLQAWMTKGCEAKLNRFDVLRVAWIETAAVSSANLFVYAAVGRL